MWDLRLLSWQFCFTVFLGLRNRWVKSRQFRTEEVPPLKEIHGQFEDLGLAHGKGELLAAFRRGTSRIDLFLVRFPGKFPLYDHPCSALGTRNTRTHNVIRHATSV